jgi:hypothetical protein
MKEHLCKKQPDFLWVRKAEEIDMWHIVSKRFDFFCPEIVYCPFCGKKLEE